MKIHHAQVHGESIAGVKVACDWCEQSFRLREAKVEQQTHTFCSPVCRASWRSEHYTGDDNPRWKGGGRVTCAWCDTELRVKPSRTEKVARHFCGVRCKAAWQEAYQVGEDHPRWAGGYSDYYGANWERQRRRALERDGYRCVVCRLSHEDHVERFGHGLHVHHVRPIREFDEKEVANALNNLTTMCRDCHAKWEGIPLRPVDGGVPADD